MTLKSTILSMMFLTGCVTEWNSGDNCKNEDPPPPGTSVDMETIKCTDKPKCGVITFCPTIESTFTQDEIGYIKLAFEDWEYSTRGAIKFVDNDPCYHFTVYKRNQDFFTSQNCGYCRAYTLDDIYINQDKVCGTRVFNAAIRHEIGHEIGLQHSDNTNAIMSPVYANSTWATPSVQTADIQAFETIFNCCISVE